MDKIKNFGIMKIRSKKAILMTITAVFISLLFFVIFSNENILPSFYTSQPINTRVNAMDSYVKSIPVIYGDSLEIATYFALNSIYLIHTASSIFPTEAQFKAELENCIQCGNLNCNSPSIACSGMSGNDLKTITDTLGNLAKENMDLNSVFMVWDLEITQNYPYDVDVRAEIEYTVVDSKFDIIWNKRENISRIVSIIGLNDPLIGINTGGSTNKPIIRSNICEFNETCWNFNKTKTFYAEQSFTYAVNGTSFLSRYWNSSSPSECCGIESFMEISDYRNVSFLDHYYYSTGHNCDQNPRDAMLLYDNIDTGFKLDAYTAGRYGISDNYTALICRPP